MPDQPASPSPSPSRARLICEDVRFGYGGTTVLDGLALQVAAGEIYALLGGNGAGKSTALRLVLGFERPRAGRILVDGIDVAADPAAARQRLAYVPESVALYEHLDPRETLDYFLALAEAPRGASVVEPALARAGLPEAAWSRRIGGFSKGMRQKVAIALAIARRAPLLLLDEPTSGLDPGASADFNRLLQALKAEGVAIVMVTHDLLGAADIADRIGFLAGGRIGLEQAAATTAGAPRFDVAALHRRYAGGAEAAA